jgi:hypothetical protein
MRKAIVLVVGLSFGCAPGPMHRKPGSNMVLPKTSSVSSEIARALLCARQGQPIAGAPTTGAGPATASTKTMLAGDCAAQLKDTVGSQRPSMRPPLLP